MALNAQVVQLEYYQNPYEFIQHSSKVSQQILITDKGSEAIIMISLFLLELKLTYI